MIIPLLKIRITALDKHQEKILNWLQTQHLGQVETPLNLPLTPKTGSERLSELEYGLAGVKFALRYLNGYREPTKKSWLEKIAPEKIKISEDELSRLLATFDFKKIVAATQNSETALSQTKNEIDKLRAERQKLYPWENLTIPANQTETLTTKTFLLSLNNDLLDDFSRQLFKALPASELIIKKREERTVYLTLIFKKDGEKKVETFISQFKAAICDLPHPDLTPRAALRLIDQQIADLQNNKQETIESLKKIARDFEKLQIIYDWLGWELAKEASRQKFIITKSTFTLDLWLEKNRFDAFKRLITKIANNNIIIQTLPLPADPDEIPVIIRNRDSIFPFETVTEMYGMPKSSELDPTPFLAPFFIAFFAFCLSDAGYGIILALASLAIIKITKAPKEKQKFFRLLTYCGVATIIVGALFGGWFGIDFDSLKDSWFKTFALTFKVLDPIKSPMILLLLSLGLGLVHLLTGVAVRMYHQFKQKKYLDGLFDSGFWLILLISLTVWLINNQTAKIVSVDAIFKYLLLAAASGLVLTQGRAQKNPALKLSSGVMSLYNIVGYVSDMLSYSRLLALGLATGIIALVINLVALIFKDLLPAFIGWPVAIVILIIGHIFNLAINILSAFIHSGRLQFVEFFPKFMEGGGTRFKPLERESKYVEIINE